MRAWYGARRAMRLEIGQIYGDKYRIIRRIGEGAMGAVYEGENVRIHRRVAIKTLHGGVASKAEVVTRFEREAQAAGRIGSEHIVEVLDMGELEDGTRFMVMEFLEGVTLAKRIRSKGRLSPDEACVFLIELLDGLAGAHQAGIIHRDLKPANVFLLHSKNGRADFVKILDFGVSKFSLLGGEEMAMTSTGAVLGTPFYMSPEQAKGSAAIDHRSDLYTVGVIAYECVTGQVPYAAETFNELLFKIVLESPPPAESFVPDLDPGFAAILRKAMAREPGDRYQTAAELSKAFSDFLARPKGAGQAPRIAAAVPTPPPAAVQAMGPGGGLGPNGAPPAPQVADRPAGFGGAAVGRAPAPRPAAGMPAPAMQGGGMHGTMAMPDGMPGMAPQGPNAGALPTPPPAPAAYPYGGGQSTVALATGPTLQGGYGPAPAGVVATQALPQGMMPQGIAAPAPYVTAPGAFPQGAPPGGPPPQGAPAWSDPNAPTAVPPDLSVTGEIPGVRRGSRAGVVALLIAAVVLGGGTAAALRWRTAQATAKAQAEAAAAASASAAVAAASASAAAKAAASASAAIASAQPSAPPVDGTTPSATASVVAPASAAPTATPTPAGGTNGSASTKRTPTPPPGPGTATTATPKAAGTGAPKSGRTISSEL
jgi:serine/threonine-protein kinase